MLSDGDVQRSVGNATTVNLMNPGDYLSSGIAPRGTDVAGAAPETADLARAREQLVQVLRTLLRIPTVPEATHESLIHADDEWRAAFPRLLERLEEVPLNGPGRLLRWPGRSERQPVLLLTHADVATVSDPEYWTHPPFEATSADGMIWGRGALDAKGPLVALSTAVDRLARSGHVPAQDVWLGITTDNESDGESARAMVAALTARGVQPWMIVDGGGSVAETALPGVDCPVALIGVAEKGAAFIELTTHDRGGRGLMSPAARLAQALIKLEGTSFHAATPPTTVEMMYRVASQTTAAMRPLVANAYRLKPWLTRALVQFGPETAALTRSTLSVTSLAGTSGEGGVTSAVAGLTVRVMVGDTVDSTVEHVRKVVHDKQIEVTVTNQYDPSPVSPTDDDAFRLLTATVATVFPDAIAAPFVSWETTDARFFTDLCERIYRFTPLRMTPDQRESVHSTDEHVRADDLVDAMLWYQQFLTHLPALPEDM